MHLVFRLLFIVYGVYRVIEANMEWQISITKQSTAALHRSLRLRPNIKTLGCIGLFGNQTTLELFVVPREITSFDTTKIKIGDIETGL